MIRLSPKMLKILGLSMSLPSTLLVGVWGIFQLEKLEIIGKTASSLLSISFILVTLGTLIIYVVTKKGKS